MLPNLLLITLAQWAFIHMKESCHTFYFSKKKKKRKRTEKRAKKERNVTTNDKNETPCPYEN